MPRICSLFAMLTFCLASTALAGDNVPQFLEGREPAEGAAALPPEQWSATKNVLWKTDLPGLGWSSPIVWENRIFLTTCVNTEKDMEPRKGLYIEDLDANKYPPITSKHLFKVYCLSLTDGSIVWEKTAYEGVPAKPHHIKNTFASETPCTDGERVYAFFGNLGMFCYDLEGNEQWQHLVEPRETRYAWGTSESPIVYKGRVYLTNDNEEESYLAALDAKTGEVLWKKPRDAKTNYSTPFIWENELRTELVISGIEWAQSYDLEGNELWKLKGRSILAIPRPFEMFGNLCLTSGHVIWGENPMYAIRPGASGDITLAEGETKSEYVIWHQPKAGPYHPTPIVIDEQLYVLLDRGLMMAYNAVTGELVYDKQRIPKGTAFTSSPWTYAGKLFCINEDGVTFAIKTGPEFEVLYTNKLDEDDMCMATPVIVGDKLLIRSSARVYCLQAGAQLSASK